MVVERVVVAVDVQHLVGQPRSYGAAVERVVRKVLSVTGNRNTVWAFTFFDSSSASGSTPLGRAGSSPFSASADDRSITSFRDCVDMLLDHGTAGVARLIHIANAVLPLLTSYSLDRQLLEIDHKTMLPVAARRNLLLLLAAAAPSPRSVISPSTAEPTEPDCEELRRIASLHNLMDKYDVHGCWLQPPGQDTDEFVDRLRDFQTTEPRWCFSGVDSFVLATLVIPQRLLLPLVVLPPLLGSGTDAMQIPPAKLRVDIAGQQHFVCHVSVARLTKSSESNHLRACSKVRLTLKAARRRRTEPTYSELDTYLVYQHRRSGTKQRLGSTREELLRKVDPELFCHRHELGCLLLFLAQEDAVALVEVEITLGETTKQLQGTLEPLGVRSATLRVTGRPYQHVDTESVVSSNRPPPTRLLSDSWGEAWRLCLELVQNPATDWMDPIFKESVYPAALTAWKNAVHPAGEQRQRCASDQEEVQVPVATTDRDERCNASGCAQLESVSLDMASSYVSALEGKLRHCVTSGNFDAGKLVRDTIAAVKATCVSPAGCPTAEKLKELLLQSAGDLSSKYTDGGHAGDHRINEYTLQIQLRLEMLAAADQAPGIEAGSFIEQICDLLYDVQFSLGAGTFDAEEGLLANFANRVVRSSFQKQLPRVVDEIYARMEFHGYDSSESNADGVEAAEAQESPTAAAAAAAPTSAASSDEETNAKKPRMMEMERARKVSHFAGRTQKLRLVRKAQPRQQPDIATTERVAETPHVQLRSTSTTARLDDAFSAPPRRSIF